jgi:hypothetical protein
VSRGDPSPSSTVSWWDRCVVARRDGGCCTRFRCSTRGAAAGGHQSRADRLARVALDPHLARTSSSGGLRAHDSPDAPRRFASVESVAVSVRQLRNALVGRSRKRASCVRCGGHCRTFRSSSTSCGSASHTSPVTAPPFRTREAGPASRSVKSRAERPRRATGHALLPGT